MKIFKSWLTCSGALQLEDFFSTQTYDVILEQKIANTEIIMTGELFFTVIYELFVGSGIMTIKPEPCVARQTINRSLLHVLRTPGFDTFLTGYILSSRCTQ